MNKRMKEKNIFIDQTCSKMGSSIKLSSCATSSGYINELICVCMCVFCMHTTHSLYSNAI